ncbi:MAG: alginate O-acetyltransferase complex protein AlgI [Alphaproteobacteria bacterium]|nr:alginate O-acetyltransferase complex protein AlgI [Alphaproteobacteria bacterium]
MVFSSIIFLFYFLPVFLTVYFMLPTTYTKNLFMLLASLLFYAWGEPWFVAFMLLMIFSNYGIALVIDPLEGWQRTAATAVGVILNLVALGIFKYADFFIQTLNSTVLSPPKSIGILGIPLPLGISFVAFHSISYLIDISRRKVVANRDPLEAAVYLSMFPQLVAGPIVRYNTVYRQLRERRTTMGRASAGMRIFIIGLAQKVLIADETARIAESVFSHTQAVTLMEAWLGLAAYTLQIYFDFMGYSNMAVGLALGLGIRFPRNFRLPYTSRSITEFWRRWHISLSAWFRDYVYIPLGGNRGSEFRTYANLCTVFFLCGLWHGASWNFVVWGIHHGFFLVIERAGVSRLLRVVPATVSWLYAMLVVMSGWVWFRAKDMSGALDMFSGMIGLHGLGPISFSTNLTLYPVTLGAMVIGAMLAVTAWDGTKMHLKRYVPLRLQQPVLAATDSLIITTFFVLSGFAIAAGSYSPFLYFRF